MYKKVKTQSNPALKTTETATEFVKSWEKEGDETLTLEKATWKKTQIIKLKVDSATSGLISWESKMD